MSERTQEFIATVGTLLLTAALCLVILHPKSQEQQRRLYTERVNASLINRI